MAYSAYGELLTGKVSGYGYNGEYYDAATGMLNLRARQYEPAQGRFSQRDGLKGWATSPRSLNAYLYCQNDAINYFDASGATMVAVNMTDGGGGRKSNSSSSNLLQKAGQTIKSVVSAAASAAAVAKAANDQALVNSILKESRDPVAQLQRVRENRAQAQATTPTVVGHSFLRSVKKFACMTQEEYDAGSEVYGPQISNSTPQLIEAQNEDNIQSAKDNLVIAGGFGITLELIFAVSFCIEFTKDPITSRYSVHTIEEWAFDCCNSLRKVHWSKNLKIIEEEAFTYCALEEISFPEGVLEIQANAFLYCNELKRVVIPGSTYLITGVSLH